MSKDLLLEAQNQNQDLPELRRTCWETMKEFLKGF